jgi:hypothetical protein
VRDGRLGPFDTVTACPLPHGDSTAPCAATCGIVGSSSLANCGFRGIGQTVGGMLADVTDLGHEIPTSLLPSQVTSTLGDPLAARGHGARFGVTRAVRPPREPLSRRRRSPSFRAARLVSDMRGLLRISRTSSDLPLGRSPAGTATSIPRRPGQLVARLADLPAPDRQMLTWVRVDFLV